MATFLKRSSATPASYVNSISYVILAGHPTTVVPFAGFTIKRIDRCFRSAGESHCVIAFSATNVDDPVETLRRDFLDDRMEFELICPKENGNTVTVKQGAHRVFHAAKGPIQNNVPILGRYFDSRLVHSPFPEELLLVVSRPYRLDSRKNPLR